MKEENVSTQSIFWNTDIQTTPIGFGGTIFCRGKIWLWNTYGCNVPFEYPVSNPYNIFVFYYFCIFCVFMTIVAPFFTWTGFWMCNLYSNVYVHKCIHVNVHSTTNRGTRYQGPIILVLNVGYILNKNYRVWGHRMLYILRFGCDQKIFSQSIFNSAFKFFM